MRVRIRHVAAFCVGIGWTPLFAQDAAPQGIVLPELGESSSAAMSPQVERRIGMEAMKVIRRDAAFLDDPEVVDYLNALGNSLVVASTAAGQDIEFFLIQDPTINAFAMPGGFVGVHTGLILAAQTESELASVLAHEISHLTQRHIVRGLGKQNELSVLSVAGLLVGLLASRGGGQAGQAIAMASQAGAFQAGLGYSRDFEREADRAGLLLLQQSGFEPGGMVAFFERLQKASRFYENNAPAYLQTHPLSVERVSDMQNRIHGMTYRQRLDRIDFQLVRARLRAEQGAGRESVAFFRQQVDDRRYSEEGAVHFGLASALARVRNFVDADRELSRSRQLVGPHPMLELLAGRLRLALGDIGSARDLLEAASKQWPSYRPVRYALYQVMQKKGLHGEVIAQIAELMRSYPRDVRLFTLQAASFAALGKVLLQHRAQAEIYALQGATQAAVEQLQIALKAGDGDFYQLSSVEARMRELRARMVEEGKAR